MPSYVDLQAVRYVLPSGRASLDNVTFRLDTAEKVAILGANGSGKSTLALLLAGVLYQTSGFVKWAVLPEPAEIQLLMQNPSLQTLGTSITEELRFGPDLLHWDSDTIDEALLNCFNTLELTRDRELTKLSGGELQRVVTEAIRILKPKLLIYDEPGMYLEPRRRQQLRQQALAEPGTMLWLTPDRDEARLFPRTIVMHEGRVVFDDLSVKLPTDEYIWQQWQLPAFTQTIQSSTQSTPDTTQSITLTNVEVKGAEHPRVSIPNLNIHAGERIGIIGDNGAGKTSLLAVLGGILKPDSGSLRKTRAFPLHSLAFQFPEQAFMSHSVREEIGGPDDADNEHIATERLEKFQMSPEQFLHRDPFTLSGGEARRIALAATILTEDTFLLWDEPTAALDAVGRIAIAQVLLNHPGGFVIAGHDLTLINTICDRIITLDQGRLISDKPITR